MRDPNNWNLTEEQCRWLSMIFRIIPKEINTAEDRDKLAPGELGINYKSGEIWVRNPHNGKIFSPNNVEFWKLLSRKFDRKTKMFNADMVKGINFYTDLIELEHLDTSYTPDTVIRQMWAPAILYAPVEYDNYKGLQWPTYKGMVFVVKLSEEYVIVRYYANGSNLEYEGRYNTEKHFFEGWVLSNGSPDDYFAESIGGGDSFGIQLELQELFDLMTVIVHVNEDINPEAGMSVNGGDVKRIIDQKNRLLDTDIVANTTIMLIYDEVKDAWVIVNSTDSISAAILRIVLERVADALLDVAASKKAMEETTAQMKREVDEKIKEIDRRVDTKLKELSDKYDRLLADMSNTIITRPGNLVPVISYFTAEHDNITAIKTIDNFDGSVDKLLVNYGQTILRAEIDYVVVNNGINLIGPFSLQTGDILQFIVMKQAKN